MLLDTLKLTAVCMLVLSGAVIATASIFAAAFIHPLAIIGLPMGFAIMFFGFELL
jgi:hypothetical protein